MIDKHEYERGDFLHLRDLTPEMVKEVDAALLEVFAARDICPTCGADMMARFAKRVRESWSAVAPDYQRCMH